MGTGILNEEFTKVEHTIVFCVISAVGFQVFSKYATVSLDITAFVIFAAMCFAGYFALKTAQDIMLLLENRKQAAYEAVKADMLLISPASLSRNSRFSKTSTYSKL